MSRAKSPLSTLLIISAIDLLLCCFTMGVMLFLVFQPSLRTDAASSPLRASAANDAAGARHVPAVIIIDNVGPNLLVGAKDPRHFRIVGDAGNGSGSTVLTTISSGDLPVFRASSADAADAPPTKAIVSVATRGVLFSQQLDCEHGASLTIDLARPDPIRWACYPLEYVASVCPTDLPQIGIFDRSLADLAPQNVRLMIIPVNVLPILTVSGGKICLMTPLSEGTTESDPIKPERTGQLLELVRPCVSTAPKSIPTFATEAQTACVQGALRKVGTTKLTGRCDFPAFGPREERAYFLTISAPLSTTTCPTVTVTDRPR